MEKATWEEIKLLASDFKKTQSISLIQKLTERNCIDIINYLCSKKKLNLYFTTDGKTFLTHEELEKEINEELEISNGRIELTKLCQLLDLDFYTIDTVTNKMVTVDSNLQIVMDCLINSSYIRGIALKINEIIKENGKISVLELTQLFKLPKAMVEKIIITNIDSGIIQAHKDEDIIYTNDFIRRHKAIICGYLTRSSKPVSIAYLNEKFSISKKLLIRLIIELNDIHQHGISGKFDQNKFMFIPDIYLRNQRTYLRSFYERNYYIDYELMKEIGIQNPVKYISTEFPEMTNLSTCALGDGIMSQLMDAIQECEKDSMFFNCYQIVPKTVLKSDLELLIEKLPLNDNENKFFLLAQEYIVSRKFIGNVLKSFDDIIKTRAENFIKNNRKSTLMQMLTVTSNQDHDQDQDSSSKREKTMKFKSGGGLTGREIKVKAVKNKYVPGNAEKKSTKKSVQSQESSQISLEFITEDESIELMRSMKCFDSDITNITNNDIPEELFKELFRLIETKLNASFKQQCQIAFVQSADLGRNKAKEHQNIESKMSALISRMKLFDSGLQSIGDIEFSELKVNLCQYLMKTVGTDIVNLLFEYVAIDNDLEWDMNVKTNDMRVKLVSQIKNNDLSMAMRSINKSLKDQEGCASFLLSLESFCALLDLFPLKKYDKKNEKNLSQEIAAQYHSIISSKFDNNEDIDPSELLLITLALLFQKITGFPLHASGKYVPNILGFLRYKAAITCSFSDDKGSFDWELLKQYQDYVISSMKMVNATKEERDSFRQSHYDLHLKIVNFALNWKSLKIN